MKTKMIFFNSQRLCDELLQIVIFHSRINISHEKQHFSIQMDFGRLINLKLKKQNPLIFQSCLLLNIK